MRSDVLDNPVVIREARCPSGVKAAARIWMLMGIFQLLVLALVLVVTLGGPASAQKASPSATKIFLSILFGVTLIVAGRQTSKGTTADTLANGVGSLIIGLLNLGVAYYLSSVFTGSVSLPDPVMFAFLVACAVGGLGGISLVLAGILALTGRDDYRAWRQSLGQLSR